MRRAALSPKLRPPRQFGFVEWFRPGEHERAARAVADMRAAGAAHLRTHLSWAEYHSEGGEAWYDWLIPTLAREIELLPSIHYTPPSLSRTGRASGPPVRLKDYADFVDHVLTRYGRHFRHLELWNEPNNLLDWDWHADRDWLLFCKMIGGAAYWAQRRGWKAVLGGPCPFDADWFALMAERGLLEVVSAVGFHGFPGTWDSPESLWRGYLEHLSELRALLDRRNPAVEIWITEAGYATWRNDEAEQVARFVEALQAPAERLYWYGWQDVPRDVPVQEGLYFDPRHYHLGVTDTAGRPKLLRRLLETHDPTEFVHRLPSGPRARGRAKPVVVIGGAGFIGSNLCDRLASEGQEVVILDSLVRPGVERNLEWLQDEHGSRLHACVADIRDPTVVAEVVTDAAAVIHLAAQVAVTSSLADPRADFTINAEGTLNVLEAIRQRAPETPLLFASTNKVYGALDDIEVVEFANGYLPADAAIRAHGIGEDRPCSFCTPYGCSKGAADQYVLDYAHSFGLRTAVLRMSCIYGPRQFGTEDQGWVAHFLLAAMREQPICIYGDGHQVRDICHVADAVAAYRAVLADIDRLRGSAFNLGGGPANAVSLRMVLGEIADIVGGEPSLAEHGWRSGDQLYFVADTRRLRAAVGWTPRIGWREGLRDLARWAARELALPTRPAADRRTRQTA